MENSVYRNNANAIYDDQSLVQSFKQGHEYAFDELYKRYCEMIKNYCIHFIGNKHDGEECFQDTFRKAYSALPKFRGNSSFKTWLFKIAKNTCYNKIHSLHFRLKKKTTSYDAPVQIGSGTVLRDFITRKTPRSDMISHEYSKLLFQVIRNLNKKRREVLILHDIQGLSYEEIEQMTNTRQGALRSRLSRARLDLLNELKKVYPHEL